MSVATTYYGWTDGELWYLSVLPRGKHRAAKSYPTKQDAIDDFSSFIRAPDEKAQLKIVWEE